MWPGRIWRLAGDVRVDDGAFSSGTACGWGPVAWPTWDKEHLILARGGLTVPYRNTFLRAASTQSPPHENGPKLLAISKHRERHKNLELRTNLKTNSWTFKFT